MGFVSKIDDIPGQVITAVTGVLLGIVAALILFRVAENMDEGLAWF
jgi:hypothetical protein